MFQYPIIRRSSSVPAAALAAIDFAFIWMSVILTVVMVIMFALLDVEKHKTEMLQDLQAKHGYAEKEA